MFFIARQTDGIAYDIILWFISHIFSFIQNPKIEEIFKIFNSEKYKIYVNFGYNIEKLLNIITTIA